MTTNEVKEGIIESGKLMFAQLVLCCIIAVNYRAIAQADYPITGISAGASAIVSFFIVKEISKKSKYPFFAWTGFIIGSILGDFAGIFLSKLMLGS
jgi:ABC-type Fe3+-siderophore transport system permease subunit